MRLGGCENKFDRWRRFFQSLQQRVERVLGDLMNFIDDVNLKSALSRLIADIFDDLANLIDAAIGRTVDFENVDRIALGNLLTLSADAARSRGWTIIAIQRLGENARECGLARAARAGEEVGVVQALRLEGVHEGRHHVLLADDLLEGPGTPLSGQDLVRHEEIIARILGEPDPRHLKGSTVAASFPT